MSKKTPAPPPAPDYAAANEAAVNADIATLGLRNAINAAAQLGTSYTDPNTGKVYDFTGLGQADINAADLQKQLSLAPEATSALLDLQKQFGVDFAEESRRQLQATDPTGFALRDSLGGRLSNGSNSIESIFDKSMSSPSGPDYAAYVRANPDLLSNWENNTSKNTGMSLEDYGRQHYESAGKTEGRSLPQFRPTVNANGLPNYEMLTGNGPTLANMAGGPTFSEVGQAATIGNGPEFQRLQGAAAGQRLDLASLPGMQNIGDAERMQRMGYMPQLSGVNGIRLADTGATAAGRGELERQIFDELNRAGSGDPALQRAAEQAARARGAASGNILGDSSALQESLAVQLAQRGLDNQRRNDALGLLSSGQGVSDTANRLAQQQQAADVTTAGFNNSANQQNYQNLLGNLAFNNSAAQQDFANQQSRAGFNNTANTQGLQSLMAAIGLNNATGAQDLANNASVAGFNNTAAQQGYSNAANAANANFQNQMAATTANNATRQQGYTNQATATSYNNDAANQAFQNAMAAIGQRNQATQNSYSAMQGQQQAKAGARQQDLANIQSFLGLQPIVSQGGQLSGLQQGAAPFMQNNAYAATGTNPNAGAQGTAFAGNIFGTQANIYGQQLANSQSPLGALAGGFLGAATGGVGQGFGSFLTKKLF